MSQHNSRNDYLNGSLVLGYTKYRCCTEQSRDLKKKGSERFHIFKMFCLGLPHNF